MKNMIAAASIVLMFLILFVIVYRNNQEWEAFKVEHECKVVQKRDGQTSIGQHEGKTVTMYTSGQTAWLCNDGVTYWKNN